jgi:DNA polymerase-4
MDAFFAAVEQKRHPEFIGRPVVIGGGGDPSQRGVVSTASYEARKFGVHSAMPLKTAYKLCPEAIFLAVDYREYSRVSHIIKDILREVCPVMEDVGIDEAFLDISEINRPSDDIAYDIKEKISKKTGLTCSIGIGPNKLIAKIASDMRKPDGLTIISEGEVEARIWPLPARKLWGVGPKTEAHLKEMGIETVGQLAAVPPEVLVETFGNSYGNFLFESSRGIDDSPLVTHWEPKSSSRETTFQRDTDKWQVVARNLADMSREVAADLKKSGYKGRNVTVKVRFSDFETVTRATTLMEPTDSVELIRKAAFECLGRVEMKKNVRLVGVRAGKLEKASHGGKP